MLYVHEAGSSHQDTFESVNGITPPMRNARKRHFKPAGASVSEVTSVEEDLLQIVHVSPCTCRKVLRTAQVYLKDIPLSCSCILLIYVFLLGQMPS